MAAACETSFARRNGSTPTSSDGTNSMPDNGLSFFGTTVVSRTSLSRGYLTRRGLTAGRPTLQGRSTRFESSRLYLDANPRGVDMPSSCTFPGTAGRQHDFFVRRLSAHDKSGARNVSANTHKNEAAMARVRCLRVLVTASTVPLLPRSCGQHLLVAGLGLYAPARVLAGPVLYEPQVFVQRYGPVAPIPPLKGSRRAAVIKRQCSSAYASPSLTARRSTGLLKNRRVR
jgi:hypothetical protein